MAYPGKVVNFPAFVGLRPSKSGAFFIDIIFGRVRELLGQLLNKLKIPGAVRDVHIMDALTGQEIIIRADAVLGVKPKK